MRTMTLRTRRLLPLLVALAALISVAVVPATTGAAERLPLFSTPCANGTFKPTRIVIACADATIRFRATNWAQWESREALAEGVLTYPNCAPNVPLFKCDKRGRDGATVRLFRPQFCPKQGRQYFTRLLMFDSEAKVKSMERIKLRFNCSDVR
jgi:hypothetical protein